MNFGELIHEARDAASEGRLSSKSDKELDEMLSSCRKYCASTTAPLALEYEPAVDALRDEITRRSNERLHNETKKQREAAMEEARRLKESVQRLEKPHKLHWWLLAIAVLTAIFAGIAAPDVILKWIRGN